VIAFAQRVGGWEVIFQDRHEYVPVGFGKNVPVFYDPEK
jgi:hypothetical protein